MLVTFKNSFHETEARANVQDERLTSSQVKRLNKKLCGLKNCCCGGVLFDRQYNSKDRELELYFLTSETMAVIELPW